MAPIAPGYFRNCDIGVDFSYDPAKRAKVFADRGIDFEQAGAVFAGPVAEMEDTRRDVVTAGLLGDRVVGIVWTPAGWLTADNIDEVYA